jgi:mono/diheme cytochrome c family protein
MKVRLICFLAVTLPAFAGSLALAARQEGNGGSKMPGRAIYDDTCSRCHGAQGRDGKAPELVPFRWNYDQALDIVRHGGSCGMPSFKESELSDEEVKQIVDYMKTLN